MNFAGARLLNSADDVAAGRHRRIDFDTAAAEAGNKIESILRKANQIKPKDPGPERLVRFTQEGSADSVTALKVIMLIEETFDIIGEDDEILPENIATLSGLVRFG